MKIKRFIAITLCLATVLVITAACGKKIDVDDVTVYETDMWGETVTNTAGEAVTLPVEDVSAEYVTDEEGRKVLDENGERVTILHYYVGELDDKGNVVTNAHKKPVTQEFVSAPENVTAGSLDDIFGETVPVVTMPEGTTVQTTQRLFDKNFREVIISGNFYMETTMSGNVDGMGMKTNVAFAVSGDKMYTKMNVNAGLINMTFENILKDGKAYTVYPKKKVYMEAASDMISGDEIKESLGSSQAKYQQTSIVTSKGVKYICEEYLVDDMTYKYYFDQKTEALKRIEYSAGDGSTVIMDIKKLSKNPAASYFEVPAGYKKVTEEEFANILTGGIASMAGVPTTKANG